MHKAEHGCLLLRDAADMLRNFDTTFAVDDWTSRRRRDCGATGGCR
jgi:hypothetical protein